MSNCLELTETASAVWEASIDATDKYALAYNSFHLQIYVKRNASSFDFATLTEIPETFSVKKVEYTDDSQIKGAEIFTGSLFEVLSFV